MASSNFREKGDKICVSHPKEECSFMCEDCDIPICKSCISTLHHGHRIKSIEIVAQDKFNFIQDFDNRIKSETIPKINDGVQAADDVVHDMKKLIDKGKQHLCRGVGCEVEKRSSLVVRAFPPYLGGLLCDMAVRQHYKGNVIPSVTSRHRPDVI